ncbi:MAG: septation protein SepH, partial [Mycobacteriales bacterium]
MRQLRFVALAEDGAAVILADDRGEQYRLAVDERLRAASRGDGARLGQIEIMMESSMRPAEIQARVRAGEAPEDIARAGSMPVERVLRFAGPVLQERALVVQRARNTRCRPVGDGEAPLLQQVVDGQLLRQGIDPASATWDAGRRANGTWRITVRYSSGRQSGEAGWVYDPLSQQIRPNDDAARDLLAAMSAAGPFVTAKDAEPRPLSVVRSAAPAAAVDPVESPAAPQPPSDPPAAHVAPAAPAAPAASALAGEEPARHVSIPSWDDIVFG